MRSCGVRCAQLARHLDGLKFRPIFAGRRAKSDLLLMMLVTFKCRIIVLILCISGPTTTLKRPYTKIVWLGSHMPLCSGHLVFLHAHATLQSLPSGVAGIVCSRIL